MKQWAGASSCFRLHEGYHSTTYIIDIPVYELHTLTHEPSYLKVVVSTSPLVLGLASIGFGSKAERNVGLVGVPAFSCMPRKSKSDGGLRRNAAAREEGAAAAPAPRKSR